MIFLITTGEHSKATQWDAVPHMRRFEDDVITGSGIITNKLIVHLMDAPVRVRPWSSPRLLPVQDESK